MEHDSEQPATKPDASYGKIIDEAVDADVDSRVAKHIKGPAAREVFLKKIKSRSSLVLLGLIAINLLFLFNVRVKDDSSPRLSLDEANYKVKKALDAQDSQLNPMSKHVLEVSFQPRQSSQQQEKVFRQLQKRAEKGNL